MKALAVVGPSDSGKTSAVATLTERLRDRGSVATVKHLTHDPDVDTEGKDTARHRSAGATHTVGLTDDGSWFATGQEQTLDDVLDQYTPKYDYALVEGFSDSTLPKVVLGDRPAADPIVATAPDADALDVDAVVKAIDDQDPRETLESLVSQAKATQGSEFSGAIATFTGRVRERNHSEDTPTKYLEFEKYDTVAEQKMATIREELCEREGVYDVRLHHKTGVVTAGEDIVFVVVLAGHRDEAFATVSDGIDRLKDEVPLFKKEVTVDDEFWRHERAE
ncbi:molybdopterin synthase [Halovenus marina]|uniref:molybdopterin synthase n=1 Tax=Halovenus marina TaxID=3396621 RepID=UPI003F546CCC